MSWILRMWFVAAICLCSIAFTIIFSRDLEEICDMILLLSLIFYGVWTSWPSSKEIESNLEFVKLILTPGVDEEDEVEANSNANSDDTDRILPEPVRKISIYY